MFSAISIISKKEYTKEGHGILIDGNLAFRIGDLSPQHWPFLGFWG